MNFTLIPLFWHEVVARQRIYGILMKKHQQEQFFELKTPIICGIGHETDFTICDYVCDLRALTPTYAAIEATPNIEDMYKHLSMLDGLLKIKYEV